MASDGMLLSFILTYVSASLAVRSNNCCEIKGIGCNDPDYCEILADMAKENLESCAREFHKNGYIPYNMALNEYSMTIAQSLVLANEHCLKQSFARVNLLIQQIETKKDLRIEHRGALWTKGRVAAALAPKDGRYYEAALDVYATMERLDGGDFEPGLRISELLIMMGRYSEALYPINKAIHNDPKNTECLRVRGTLHFLDNNFDEAIKDFKLAVDTDPTPELYYYYALSLYHEGHLGAALHAISSALEVRADQPDVLRLQAQLFKETGQFDKALKSLNEALSLDYKSAESIIAKGELYFDAGRPQQASRWFQKCTKVEPWNIKCEVYKGLCLVNTGKFYDGIKELTTRVLRNYPLPGQKPTNGQIRSFYIREWARYLSMAADKAHLGTYPENELPRKFTLSWLTNENWLINDIPEFNDGKGLSNSVDVETTPWENMDEGKKKLACLALKIGQYHRSLTDLENPRKEMAIGLAAIEIFQRFKNEDRDSQKVSTMQLSWKEAAAVANKWIRMVDLNEPSFWIDDLYTGKLSGIPPEVLYHQVGTAIPYQYQKYHEFFFKYSKSAKPHLGKTGADNISDMIAKGIEPGEKEMIPLLAGSVHYSTGTFREGTFRTTPGKTLLAGEIVLKNEGFVDSASKSYYRTVATAKIERSKAQFDQFKQELDTVWARLYIDKDGDDDSLEYAWLLYFYFTLLAPTNENTSEIAFAVTYGALLSLRQFVFPTGSSRPFLPPKMILKLEVMQAQSPEEWVRMMKQYYNYDETRLSYDEWHKSIFFQVPEVKNKFKLLRDMTEILNIDTYQFCDSSSSEKTDKIKL